MSAAVSFVANFIWLMIDVPPMLQWRGVDQGSFRCLLNARGSSLQINVIRVPREDYILSCCGAGLARELDLSTEGTS
jgi:hypothetical protein